MTLSLDYDSFRMVPDFPFLIPLSVTGTTAPAYLTRGFLGAGPAQPPPPVAVEEAGPTEGMVTTLE